ncbi:MAG: DNA topoisomerase IB, partial [Actinomycetota bacterium]
LIKFTFVGKSGKRVSLDTEHPRCARVIKRCRELPGYRLFRYEAEDGSVKDVDSDDVNGYLREITGEDVTAKDFRTWGGSVLFARAARDVGSAASERETTRGMNLAVEAVSHMLGNTPAVCRSCYIHPALMDAYRDGELEDLWSAAERAKSRAGLRRDEIILLAMLRALSRRKTRAHVKRAAA